MVIKGKIRNSLIIFEIKIVRIIVLKIIIDVFLFYWVFG